MRPGAPRRLEARRTGRAVPWALLVALGLTACGGAATPETAKVALRGRLEKKGLSVRSVACIDSGLQFESASVFRCNVNFGDPHIVPYCVAVVGDTYLTDRERPSMRCYRPEDEQRYRDAVPP